VSIGIGIIHTHVLLRYSIHDGVWSSGLRLVAIIIREDGLSI